MNLEDSMNLAVLGFGVTTVLTLIGVLAIIIGIALIAVSMAVWLYRGNYRRMPVETTV